MKRRSAVLQKNTITETAPGHKNKEFDMEVQQMFQPGDLIVYGNNGVCRVIKVGKPEVTVANGKRLYYTLQPLYSTEIIYTPVDSGVFMRPVISRDEAGKADIANTADTRKRLYEPQSHDAVGAL